MVHTEEDVVGRVGRSGSFRLRRGPRVGPTSLSRRVRLLRTSSPLVDSRRLVPVLGSTLPTFQF